MISRRSLLSTIAAALAPRPALSQQVSDEFRDKCMAVERPWNIFIRELVGCPSPSGETTKETCVHPPEIDNPKFMEAKHAAKKLWDLTEKA